MVFNDQGSTRPPVTLAISQPSHAVISGRILRVWAEPLHEETLLAAAQHDIAWLDWEMSPSFDPMTKRPHFFRAIGAAQHVPMWERGVDRAYAAYDRRVALLVSRHANTIYERFSDRHRSADPIGKLADEQAAGDYLGRHRPQQEQWARALGLDADAVTRDAGLIAFADNLSLVLCGAIPAPPQLDMTGAPIRLAMVPDKENAYTLDPWPLSVDEIFFETEARALPPSGRFENEASMRAWLAHPARTVARSSLRRRR